MATEPICIDLDDEGTWRPPDLLCELLLPQGGEQRSVGEASIKQVPGDEGTSSLVFSVAPQAASASGRRLLTSVSSTVVSHLTVESSSTIVLKLQEPVAWEVCSSEGPLDHLALVTNEPELHTVLSTLRWWLPHVVVQGTLPQQLDDPVVLRLEGISLTARDIELLGDEQCLNDSVLDFFLKLAVDLVAPEHLKGELYVASTFFYQKLTAGGVENGEAGWQNVRRWTRSLPHGLLGQRFVVLPINEQNIHWWLAVVCHARHALEPAEASAALGKAPRIVCLDSAQEPPLKNRVVAFLRGYLWKEWCERHPSAMTEEGSLDKVSGLVNLQAIAADVPKQANSFDCGIFIIEYLLHLLRSKTALAGLGLAAHKHWFGQASVSYRRKRLKWIAKLLQHHAKRLDETDVNQLLQEPKVRKAVAMALTELPRKAPSDKASLLVSKLKRAAASPEEPPKKSKKETAAQ